jgi:spermidine synthase
MSANPSDPLPMPRWLYGLFFLSGISGLMYEVVWFRMLGRVLGSTVHATATVLAAFMAGLALGSLAAGRFIDRSRRPLLWYAAAELMVGMAALLSRRLPELVLPIHRTLCGFLPASREGTVAGEALAALLVLVPPAALMGATLPILCSFGSRRRASFGRCAGTLYALNTLGAVVGVLAAGFLLLGAVGEGNTLRIGAILNVAAAGGAVLGGRSFVGVAPSGDLPQSEKANGPQPPEGGTPTAVLACFAVAGFCALGNEVVWGRLLTLYQGTSVYAFAAMLAVLLAGMGVGSWLGARRVDGASDPRRRLARLLMLGGLAALLALHLYPRWAPIKPNLSTGTGLPGLLLVPLLLVGPLGLVWGFTFPAAARCLQPGPSAAGKGAAALAAWNTTGAVVGSLTAGFVLVPWLGLAATGTALAVLSFAAGLLLLVDRLRLGEWGMVAACGLLVATVGDPCYDAMRRAAERLYPGGVTWYRHVEDSSGSTTAFGALGKDFRSKQLWIGGEGMTALVTETKLMAHLPLWLADAPRDVLVVCFGMGTTARSASRHDRTEVWAVELVPAVFDCFGFYHADGPELLRSPRVHPVVDDGRHFLLTRSQQFDVLTVDPAPPLYSAGAVNLYTREFFQLCRGRLRPQGAMCLWVPPANRSEILAIFRTFLEAFEHVQLWEGPAREVAGRGFYLLGSRSPFGDVESKIRAGFRDAKAAADLREWGPECDGPEKVLALFLAQGEAVRELVAAAPAITDDRPFTEFPLWRAWWGRDDYLPQFGAPQLRAWLNGRRHAARADNRAWTGDSRPVPR